MVPDGPVECLLVEALEEEAAGVAEDLWLEQEDAIQRGGRDAHG
jgi:hypothetical protein